MKVVIKNSLRDTLAFLLHLNKRRRIFRRAAARRLSPGAMNILAGQLHPERQVMRIAEVRSETPTSRTFILVPAGEGGKVAFFRAGQYIAVEDAVGGTPVSRPFSIASSPDEAAETNGYMITVKSKADGFFAPWVFEDWKPGKTLTCSAPEGTFFHEPIRDARRIVCIAGGSGVTPFRSILKDGLEHTENTFHLLYGVTGPREVMYRDELENLEKKYPERFSLTIVTSGGAPGGTGETGFITSDIIRKHVPDATGASFFICGPPAMHLFLQTELEAFHLPRRRIRRESYGGIQPGTEDARRFSITVLSVEGCTTISAAGGETVLVALERAGLNPPAFCRSGECGWCRSRLVEGDVYVPEDTPGVRRADKKFGWFHPCSSYPRSDLVVEIPKNPLHQIS